jgi:hypothetical protein
MTQVVASLLERAAKEKDVKLREFSLRWYDAVYPWAQRWGTGDRGGLESYFPDNPLALLLAGKSDEYWMGPEIDGPPHGRMVTGGAEFFSTNHYDDASGPISPTEAADGTGGASFAVGPAMANGIGSTSS